MSGAQVLWRRRLTGHQRHPSPHRAPLAYLLGLHYVALVMSSDTVGVEERYAVFPFYLCLDVSASMSGDPIDGVNAQMPALRHAIGEDPAIAEVIRFGVITFSDVARTVLPLSDLSMVEEVPAVAAQGRTSYASAFDHLRVSIEADYHASRAAGDRWYRPAVLFVSDGRPTAEDVVLDHAAAATRFGPDAAALIFNNQPGPIELTYRTAALRYGAPAAALIFPASAGTQAPAVNDDGGGDPLLALPAVDRAVP